MDPLDEFKAWYEKSPDEAWTEDVTGAVIAFMIGVDFALKHPLAAKELARQEATRIGVEPGQFAYGEAADELVAHFNAADDV